MCGIVGYVGPRPVMDVLMPGLAGSNTGAMTRQGWPSTMGDRSRSSNRQDGSPTSRVWSIGKTWPRPTPGSVTPRWATHGAPNTGNAHPHLDCHRDVVVVHNGIIENWVDLKAKLIENGHEFESDTDTEVVAHMIEEMTDLPLADAVRSVMNQADGALALVVMRKSEPDVLVGARRVASGRWPGKR